MSKLTFVPNTSGEINVFWEGKIVGTMDKFYTNHALVSLVNAIQNQYNALKDIPSKQ